MFANFKNTKVLFASLALLFVLAIVFTPALQNIQAADPSFDPTGGIPRPEPGNFLTCLAPGSGYSAPECVLLSVTGTLIGWITELVGLLLRLASLLFSYVLKITVLEFSTIGNNAGISAGWATFRDAGNIFFIFILLYAAIGTILNLHNVDAKKMVVRVIIVALLVNFSGVFTKVLIDSSNSIATYYYQSATLSYCNAGDTPEECSIGDSVMNILKLVRLSSLGNVSAGVGGVSSGSSPWISMLLGSFLGILFILLTTVVLIASCLFFAVRAIVLLFLLVTAPAAYIGWMLPGKGEEIKSMWWGKLTKELIFAPVFFLLFQITIKVGVAAGRTVQGTSIIEVVVFYIIFIGLMLGCLMIASSLGAYGAGAAEKFGKMVSLGAVAGAGAMLGRNTIGRGAQRIAESQRFQQLTALAGPTLGRGMRNAVGATAGASFGGAAGGYVAARDASEKAKKEFADSHAVVTPYQEQRARREATGNALRDLDSAAASLRLGPRLAGETDAAYDARLNISSRAADTAASDLRVAGIRRQNAVGDRLAPTPARTTVGRFAQRLAGASPSSVVAGASIQSQAGKNRARLATFVAQMQQRENQMGAISTAPLPTTPPTPFAPGQSNYDAMDRIYNAAVNAVTGISDDMKAAIAADTGTAKADINAAMAAMHTRAQAHLGVPAGAPPKV